MQYLGRLLAAERRARGTRRDTRALSCFYQALLVLVWFRKAEDVTLLGAGFGISRATAYRYRDEGIAVLAAQATDLHTALRRAAADGWSHVILDGKLFDCDRLPGSGGLVGVRRHPPPRPSWVEFHHATSAACVHSRLRHPSALCYSCSITEGELDDSDGRRGQ